MRVPLRTENEGEVEGDAFVLDLFKRYDRI